MRRAASAEGLAEELKMLTRLSREDLIARWVALYGGAPPPRTSRSLMIRAVAYKMQERVHGGLSASTRALKLRAPSNERRAPAATWAATARAVHLCNGRSCVEATVCMGWSSQEACQWRAVAPAFIGPNTLMDWTQYEFELCTYGAHYAILARRPHRPGVMPSLWRRGTTHRPMA